MTKRDESITIVAHLSTSIYVQGSERAAANAHPRLLAPWSAGDSSQQKQRQKQRQKQQSGYPAVNTSIVAVVL